MESWAPVLVTASAPAAAAHLMAESNSSPSAKATARVLERRRVREFRFSLALPCWILYEGYSTLIVTFRISDYASEKVGYCHVAIEWVSNE